MQSISVPRTNDTCYFKPTQAGAGPFTPRVTDWYGNVLLDSSIAHIEKGSISGADQFPPGL